MLDGPEYRALSPDGKLTLLTARASLGPSGLASVPGFLYLLAERTGYPHDVQRESWRRVQDAGWGYYDGTVAWIVRALDFEPGYTLEDPKHRLGFHRHLCALPRTALVGVAAERYADWLTDKEGVPLSRPVFPIPDPPLSEWLARAYQGPAEGQQWPCHAPPKQGEVKEKEKGKAEEKEEGYRASAAAREQLRRDELLTAVRNNAPDHLERFEAEIRAAGNPGEFVGEILALQDGSHGPGGRPVPLGIIGQAIHDIRFNKEQLTARRLRVFCGDLLRAPTAANGSSDDTLAMAEAIRTKQRAANVA